MCVHCGDVPPHVVAWADRLKAEIRDEARAMYVTQAAEAGIALNVAETVWTTIYDPLFDVGADATLVVLQRHGCLKRAER